MRMELWGTFAVMDHLRPRPFVAEVLIYDRLIIPRPTTPEEEPPIGDELDEITRWGRNGWQPQKLQNLLNDYLGDLAVPIPWRRELREAWKESYQSRFGMASSANDDIRAIRLADPDTPAAHMTRDLFRAYADPEADNKLFKRLMAFAKSPNPNTKLEPVVAYASLDDFQKEMPIKEGRAENPDSASFGIFEWQFFMPEDEDPGERGDISTLLQAVKLARREDFREVRQFFQGWLRNMHDGEVDPEDAKREMERLLEEYRAMLEGQGWRKGMRWACKVAPVVAPLAGLLGDVFGIATGVATGATALYVQDRVREPKVPDRLMPAAMVHDTRRFVGQRMI